MPVKTILGKKVGMTQIFDESGRVVPVTVIAAGPCVVTQIKSTIGCKQNQRDTLRSLGLKRIGDVVVKEDRPEIRGMVNTVRHLVTYEEVE